MCGSPFGRSPRACLVYITVKDVAKGQFLRAAYKSKAKGVSTSEDRRDDGGMDYVNR